MNLVYGHDKQVHDFVSHLIPGCERGFGPCKALGIQNDDQLVGGVVYHNWNPESEVIEMSAAATTPRWLTRPVLHGIFSYPFDQIGVQLIVLRVSEHDKRLASILKRYGFESVSVPRLRGRDEAEIIYTLTDEKWRSNSFEKGTE